MISITGILVAIIYVPTISITSSHVSFSHVLACINDKSANVIALSGFLFLFAHV